MYIQLGNVKYKASDCVERSVIVLYSIWIVPNTSGCERWAIGGLHPQNALRMHIQSVFTHLLLLQKNELENKGKEEIIYKTRNLFIGHVMQLLVNPI